MRPIFVAFKSAQDSLCIYVFVMPVACMEVKFRHRPSNFTAFVKFLSVRDVTNIIPRVCREKRVVEFVSCFWTLKRCHRSLRGKGS